VSSRIRFDSVSKRYGDLVALREVSLEVRARELMMVVGASGCGKTTLLKCVNRLVEPSSGRVSIDDASVAGRDPAELRRSIGYVFQRFGLFPHMTVAGNVAVVPQLLGWPDEAIARRVGELLGLVGLAAPGLAERYPHELSGGQQQRVGLARALAARPKVMLLDEPFGALDPVTRDKLQIEYRKLHEQLELTTILVTHDMTEALLLGDRITVMDRGEVLQVAAPGELLRAPANAAVKSLMDTPRRQLQRLESLSTASKT